MNVPSFACAVAYYEMRFEALSGAGRTLSFPCDAQGQIDMDSLSESARHNYLYARAVLGREYAWPTVIARSSIEPH